METQTPSQTTRIDVYALITEQIIKQLENGTVPWRKPWNDGGLPRNLFSKKYYRGMNLLLLAYLGYEQNLFLTFKQVKEIGGKVKQGEKGHPVVYWGQMDKKDEQGIETPAEESKPQKKRFLRYYTVFNVAQCENIPDGYVPMTTKIVGSIESCETIVANMPQRPEIKHKEQSAYYNPLQDFINMPKKNTFGTAEAYYVTLFHELVHSTGHHSRLKRKGLIEMAEFGSDPYSQEELVAEIGACYLQSHAGVVSEFEQSAAYIDCWLAKLKGDKTFIYTAATQAQAAVDFILDIKPEPEEELTQA
jgi:antirestriction protein ArdC